MHREFFLSSRSVVRAGIAKLEFGEELPGETGPSLESRLFSEGCAPTFADVQLYLPKRSLWADRRNPSLRSLLFAEQVRLARLARLLFARLR